MCAKNVGAQRRRLFLSSETWGGVQTSKHVTMDNNDMEVVMMSVVTISYKFSYQELSETFLGHALFPKTLTWTRLNFYVFLMEESWTSSFWKE